MADLSAYYGLTDLTVEFWAKPGAADIGTDHGLVCLGPSDGDAFSNHTFVLSMDLLGFYANVDGTVSDNVYTSTVLLSTTGGLDCARIEGASGEQSTAAQHLALLFRSGQLMEQRKNGVPTAPTFVGEGDSSHPPHDHVAGKVLTGTTAAPTSGGLRLGAGPVGLATGDYRGQLAELRIYPAYRSVAVMASEIQSYSDHDSFMGHSTFAAPLVNQGPVAAPMAVTCPASGSVDLDVLGASFEPDGDAMTLRSRTSGASGSSRIVLPFTSGGSYQILTGDTITGVASGVTATINGPVTLTSGSWAGGDAAGTLTYSTQSGIWQSENLNVGAHTDVATINPTQAFIRYSNTDATATSDTCTYTITDPSGLTSTGKISVTIDQDGEIPQALNTFNVNGDSQLTAYLAGDPPYGARAPGDMVIMTGTYSAKRTFSLDASAQPTKPYIFKAASKQAATVACQWTIQGKNQFFWGFKLTRNPTSVTWDGTSANENTHTPDAQNVGQIHFGGDDNILRRWEFVGWDAPWALSIEAGNNGIVDYCEWHDPYPWTGTHGADAAHSTGEYATNAHCLWGKSADEPFRMGVRTNEKSDSNGIIANTWHYDFQMRRCYGHDFPDKPWPNDYGSGQDDWAEIGQTGGNFAKKIVGTLTGSGADQRALALTDWFHSQHTYEYLLLENHAEGAGSAGGASLDFKAPAVTVKKVTMNNCGGSMDMRWGPKHVWEDIVFKTTRGANCYGYGSTISRMKMTGGAKLNMPMGEAVSIGQESGHINHQATQAMAVTQVSGTIQVGNKPTSAYTFKAYDHVFTNCGAVTCGDGATRQGCHADGIGHTVEPTECLITDVGLMADYVPGEYD